jgi:isopentenyl diphosphate isomerase/L-lactate dehydrogenase-like FMN-dependent dehydrogenase
MILPEILDVVKGEIPVFVDCGIQSGIDAYKCLALGASAVGVGRHLMPLLKKGADATAARMKEMTAELAGLMARTGVCDTAHFDASVIHKRQ